MKANSSLTTERLTKARPAPFYALSRGRALFEHRNRQRTRRTGS